MSKREDLIQSLCADLEPVKPVMSVERQALVWLLLSAVFVLLITAAFGPIRGSALDQLLSSPRFLMETVLGVFAIALVGFSAFLSAVPGRSHRYFAAISLGMLALWLLQYVIGLVDPTLPPSPEGERSDCWLQTMTFAIPPMLLAAVMVRRLYPLKPLQTALRFCLAAGMLPALYMQLACMYDPSHILHFHVLPGLGIALVGAGLLARLLTAKSSGQPRHFGAE